MSRIYKHAVYSQFVLTQFGLLVFGPAPLRPLPSFVLSHFALLLVRPFTTSSSYCLRLPCLVLLFIVLSRFRTLPHGPISFLSSYCFGILILTHFHFVDYFLSFNTLSYLFFGLSLLSPSQVCPFSFRPSYNVENACSFDATHGCRRYFFFIFYFLFCFLVFFFFFVLQRTSYYWRGSIVA